MLSPQATPDVAARPAPGRGERELKFTLPAARAQLARRRLETLCRRDPEFPAAIVWTIYYDTPALVSLGEKINSDYLKRKIRVRWYSDLEGRVTGPAFVEAKLRVGHSALESARAAALSRRRDRAVGPAGPAAAAVCRCCCATRAFSGRTVAADDAAPVSPRSLHRAAHAIARQPGCGDCRGPR